MALPKIDRKILSGNWHKATFLHLNTVQSNPTVDCIICAKWHALLPINQKNGAQFGSPNHFYLDFGIVPLFFKQCSILNDSIQIPMKKIGMYHFLELFG